MGVSATSATSSNTAYDDPYASTNPPNPPDRPDTSTTGNDSDTTASGGTETHGAADDDQRNSNATPASSENNTQNASDASNTGASTESTTGSTSSISTLQQSENSTAHPAAQSDTQRGDGGVSGSAGTTAPALGTQGGLPNPKTSQPEASPGAPPPSGTGSGSPSQTKSPASPKGDTKATLSSGHSQPKSAGGLMSGGQREGRTREAIHSQAAPHARASNPPPAGGSPIGNSSFQPQEQAPTNAQFSTSTPVLQNATPNELNGLLTKYDTENDGRTQDSRNRANDAATASKIQQANDLDYTGYPQEVRAFEQRRLESQAQLAALPPEMRDYYAGQLAALATAYRNIPSPDARSEIDQKATAVERDILAEYNYAINDTLDRTMAIFNRPVGAGYLDTTFQDKLKSLEQRRNDFLNAPDAAHREEIFRQTEKLKTELQHEAANGAGSYLQKDRAQWDDANQYVDRLVADAENIQDPSKRYKSIGDGLFSLNTGMGEDSVADRRVLAFTQRMMDSPDLREKLDKWQSDAGKALNDSGVSAALPYTQVLKDLPAAGPDYVRDLADRYTDVIKGQTQGEREAAFNRVKPYLQVIEGLDRFLLGLTPLAPLAGMLDSVSTLSPAARMGIDIGSAIAGTAAGPLLDGASAGARAAGTFLSDLRADAALADESAQDIEFGLQDGKLALKSGSGEAQGEAGSSKASLSPRRVLEPMLQGATQEGEAAQTAYKPAEMGPSLDPRMLDARARIESNPMAVPPRYATDVDGSTLTPDENAPGVLNDANNQHYIRSGDHYYKAKYDSGNDTWRAVNPDAPNSFSYPVRYDPQAGTWSVHGDVGGPGGGPLSRLVSLGKYVKSDPRIAKLVDSKILKPQNPQTCFLDHGSVAKNAADVPDGRLVPVSSGPLSANQLRAQLEKGPLVLSARNIARPDSNYAGMHTVVLLKTVKENGRDYVLGIDLDDTIGRNGQAQNLENGDFGGVEYDLDQLTSQATPYVDEDTGAQLEMYHRPEEKKGIWSWFS